MTGYSRTCRCRRSGWKAIVLFALALPGAGAHAQGMPSVADSKLAVRVAVSGLTQPTTMAFFSANEMFVLEKRTGKVLYVVGGTVRSTAVDLAVNGSSERGLLGIAIDPEFSSNRFVYLYWTCASEAPSDSLYPTAIACDDMPAFGPDDTNMVGVPLLGNRVDRFVWSPGTRSLTFDRNLIKLRAFQNDGGPVPPGQGDEGQPATGNHNGGVLTFGADGKLYILMGDNGRRGQLQNLPFGPNGLTSGPMMPDDQFGGPEPDNAHLSGVILRLNRDGSIPQDNPFYAAGAVRGGEVGFNIQKIFAYGIRNGFGMAVDPVSGKLWMSENGDHSFDELNIVEPGFNSGWVQIMGPLARLADFKAIETHPDYFGLQQRRWAPNLIADSQSVALSRLFMLPGAQFSDPEFSWKYAVAPAAIGFMTGNRLGPNYTNDLFVGMSIPVPNGGALLRFKLTGNRNDINAQGGLGDKVDDNTKPREFGESSALIFGTNFGVVTDIKTGPNGSLYVVSLSHGRVYEIYGTKIRNGGDIQGVRRNLPILR